MMFVRNAVLSTLLLAASAGSALADGDATKGKSLFGQCRACHTLEAGRSSGLGPNLFAIVGREVAAVSAFNYSPSYKQAKEKGVTWTPELILEYLADPVPFMRKVSGDPEAKSKMVFKMPKEQDRLDMVEYLKTVK